MLWYCSYDIGRHLSIPAYAVLGIAWIAHLLPREIGRSAIWLIGPSDHLTVVVMVAMVVLIAVSIGFVMNDSIPTLRPFFAELNGMRAPVASSEEAFVPVGVSDSISSALETATCEDADNRRLPCRLKDHLAWKHARTKGREHRMLPDFRQTCAVLPL